VYNSVNRLPSFMTHFALWSIGYLNVCLGIDLPMFGMIGEASGHYGVYDCSGYDLEQVSIPMTPYLRINNISSFGKVIKKPVVIDGEIKV